MILSKSSPPWQSLQRNRLLEVTVYLLCHKIDVDIVFEILVELDYMRMILQKRDKALRNVTKTSSA